VFKQGHDVCVCVAYVPHYRNNGDFQNRVSLYNDVNDWEDRNATGWQAASNHMWTKLNLTKKNQCEFFATLY